MAQLTLDLPFSLPHKLNKSKLIIFPTFHTNQKYFICMENHLINVKKTQYTLLENFQG